MTKERRGRAAALPVLLGLVLTATACAGETSARTPSSPTSTPANEPAELEITPAARASDVRPDEPVTIRASSGRLESVRVSTEDGERVEGRRDGRSWTSKGHLQPDTRYLVRVEATGPDGRRTTEKSSFRTLEPEQDADYDIVYNDWTVGVAMPVSIQFEEPVDEEYRASIEEAVSVESSTHAKGSWGWLDSRQLMWRPKEFWEPGTTVSIDAPLSGYQTGPDSWIDEDRTGSMTIGRRQMTEVDIAGHEMQVERDGETLKTFPISSGRPGEETETRSGMKVVIRKVGEMTMDSSTVGIEKGEEGYYRTDTDHNVRVTWTGEFIHSAPWSVDAQGSRNVSHGCVNLAPENAEWFYEHTLVGDPVDFTGSDRRFEPEEGIGVWQYGWQDWQDRSAVG